MTNELKHTPGPWVVANDIDIHDRLTEYDKSGVRVGDTPNMICRVEYPYGKRHLRNANASLIAAAPTMYAKLKSITELADFDENDGTIDLGELLLKIQREAQRGIDCAAGGVRPDEGRTQAS